MDERGKAEHHKMAEERAMICLFLSELVGRDGLSRDEKTEQKCAGAVMGLFFFSCFSCERMCWCRDAPCSALLECASLATDGFSNAAALDSLDAVGPLSRFLLSVLSSLSPLPFLLFCWCAPGKNMRYDGRLTGPAGPCGGLPA